MEILIQLRKARKYQEMSQKTLANKCSVSQSTIAQIESGRKTPSISTLSKIAEALGYKIVLNKVINEN